MNIKFFFLLILISIFISISPNKIVFPFSTKYFSTGQNDEFKNIFHNEIFTTIEIGEPPQKVELYLTTNTRFFIIKKNETFPEYYKNISSSTYKYYDNSSIYYFNDNILKRGIQSSEKAILYDSFESGSKISTPILDFIYCTHYEEDSERHMGILGLQYFPTSFIYSKEINMMAHLKKRKLTTNYAWNLNYTTSDSGYLVIGDYPHNFDPDKYKKDDMKQINVHREGAQRVEWNLYFNEIKYGNIDISSRKTGKFTPQYGVILGPSLFDQMITKEFFEVHVNNHNCERKTYNDDFDYYVCNENLDLSNFKNIEFLEKEISSKKFILTKDDLFVKKNGKIYFLIVFGRSWQWTYCWYLGKPFMKKYNFVFDEDNSQIIYYDKSESKSIVEKKSFVYFIWIGIGILVIIIAILVFVLMKLLKERKKKMFELEDDFDYKVEDGKNEENKNDKTFTFEGDEGKNKFGI